MPEAPMAPVAAVAQPKAEAPVPVVPDATPRMAMVPAIHRADVIVKVPGFSGRGGGDLLHAEDVETGEVAPG